MRLIPTISSRIFLTGLVALVSCMVRAQDIHYSQYFASPLLQNPANTGLIENGYWRVGLNYRNQWQSVTVPWRTYDLYGDLVAFKNFRKFPFSYGVGFAVVRDRAGDGDLGTTKVLVSGAAHYKVDGTTDHTISLGIQTGFIMKSINWHKLYFGNQWSDVAFNKNLPTFENYKGSSIGYPDLAVGLKYKNISNEKYNYYLSTAVYHLINPRETFFNGGTNNLGYRPVIGAGVGIKVRPDITIMPSMNFMLQKKASELLFGGMIGYQLKDLTREKIVAYAGIYNRTKDAFYPTIGLDYGRWRGFVSYDINYSELKPASSGRGGVELSLVYVGGISRAILIDIPCPRF